MVKRPLLTMLGKGGNPLNRNRNLVVQIIGGNCGVQDTDIGANTRNPQVINFSFPQVVIKISILK
jgi:hypothetical protein